MTEKNTFAVALKRSADPMLLSGIMASALRIPRFEASKKTLISPGIPARGLTGEEAQRLSGELKRSGVDSIVVAENEIPQLPVAFQVRGARLGDECLRLHERQDPAGGEVWRLPWNLHFFLCCGRIKITVEERKREAVRRSLPRYGRVAGVNFSIDGGPVRETKIRKKTSVKIFFDLIPLGTSDHFRIIGEEFNYLALGLDQPTVFESLSALIRNISRRCKNPCSDASIDNLLDGDPLTNTAFPSPEAYENHLQHGVLLNMYGGKSL